MHEKSSRWKNQNLNHSGAKSAKNSCKVCANHECNKQEENSSVLKSKLYKNTLKSDFPHSRTLENSNGGKVSVCLYKRTPRIRDMFQKNLEKSVILFSVLLTVFLIAVTVAIVVNFVTVVTVV